MRSAIEFGATIEEFMDMDLNTLDIYCKGRLKARETALNDQISLGIRNAIKNSQAVWGNKKVTDYDPIDFNIDATSQKESVIEKRNAKVMASLKAMGIID